MKLDILLPTNLSEIPLSRYQEFIAMKEKSNDEEFIAQKMIQIFCGMNFLINLGGYTLMLIWL